MEFLTEAIAYLKNFLIVGGDYIYITLLKYVLFIADNYMIAYPILIGALIIVYFLYNFSAYKRGSWGHLFMLSLIAPISLPYYTCKLIYTGFERFIYYKLWGIDYMNDVPRRKRDYILERSIRNTLQKQSENKKSS